MCFSTFPGVGSSSVRRAIRAASRALVVSSRTNCVCVCGITLLLSQNVFIVTISGFGYSASIGVRFFSRTWNETNASTRTWKHAFYEWKLRFRVTRTEWVFQNPILSVRACVRAFVRRHFQEVSPNDGMCVRLASKEPQNDGMCVRLAPKEPQNDGMCVRLASRTTKWRNVCVFSFKITTKWRNVCAFSSKRTTKWRNVRAFSFKRTRKGRNVCAFSFKITTKWRKVCAFGSKGH